MAKGEGARDAYRPENIDAQRRQELAYQLLIAGVTSFQKIADASDPGRPGHKLYADRGAAHKAVKSAIARHIGFEETEELRQVTLMRLDAAMRAIWPNVLRGDSWAHQRFNEHMQLHAKIAGTLAPMTQRIEVLTTDVVDQAILELTEKINAEQLAIAEMEDPRPALTAGDDAGA